MIILAGALFVLAGLLRLGFITQFLSRPVMAGFVFGFAIFVTVSQLPKIFGIAKGDGDTVEQFGHLVTHLGSTSVVTLAVGAGGLVLLFGLERFAPRVPGGISLQALSKLAEVVDGRYQIVSQPPIVVPGRDLAAAGRLDADEVDRIIRAQLRTYRSTLQEDRRHLLEQFQVVDFARKVIGVGSVGTRAFIVLLQGRDEQDPLFLQLKEASASVLEDHLPKSRYKQHGGRVVHGQRMMQATSDIYLGWNKGVDTSRHFYWRQLRDMKGSAIVEAMAPFGLNHYASICGWTLARAHARSGDPIAIGAYLGSSDKFDRSITAFCERYADQNEQDYQAFTETIRNGKLEAVEGV